MFLGLYNFTIKCGILKKKKMVQMNLLTKQKESHRCRK